MRKRQLKKFAKNARKNREPYRRARGKGSKKDCRRLKAFKRLERHIKKERLLKVGRCIAVLEQIDAYTPKNDQERQNLALSRAKVQAVLDKHRKDIEFDQQTQRLQAEMAIVQKTVMGFINRIKASKSVG